VYFGKWGVANGTEQIGRLFGDVGGRLESIRHDYATFNARLSSRPIAFSAGA
jgi:hypothetical protein